MIMPFCGAMSEALPSTSAHAPYAAQTSAIARPSAVRRFIPVSVARVGAVQGGFGISLGDRELVGRQGFPLDARDSRLLTGLAAHHLFRAYRKPIHLGVKLVGRREGSSNGG